MSSNTFGALEALAFLLAVLSAILDGFVGIMNAIAGSLLVVPSAIVLGEDIATAGIAFHN